MEKGDDMVMKGASVLDRAKDEVVAITDTVHGALHSVKKGETEEKAERLKGGLKHLLHKAKAKAKAPPFYDKAKADIKDHLLFSNHNFIGELGEGEGNAATHPAPAETEINAKKQGQTNSSPADHESTSIPIPIPIPEQQVTDDGNKERDHNNYFAQFFEKCCQPFNNQKLD